MSHQPFENPNIQAVFDQYPDPVRKKLQSIRTMIYGVAQNIDGVGQLEETLKWGQPSYLTSQTKSGTTIRIDQIKNDPEHIAVYVSCQTTLIETFRTRHPELDYEGDRAIHFHVDDDLPIDILEDFIGMTLTYHLRKKKPVK